MSPKELSENSGSTIAAGIPANAVPAMDIIQAIEAGRHGDVFSVLGAHRINGKTCIRVFQPHADTVALSLHGETRRRTMARVGSSGIFILEISGLCEGQYRLYFDTKHHSWQSYDPYSFRQVISDTDNYLMSQAKRRKNYEILGANVTTHYGIEGVHFAVWAPNASRVSVIGNFNGWDGRIHVMRNHPGSGVWEIFLPELTERELYKYEILDQHGQLQPLKSDPYAYHSQAAPDTASIILRKNNFQWSDADWLKVRAERQTVNSPLSIYEVHLGSWRRASNAPRSYLSYRDLAHQLADHIDHMGFTHVQLLPITEYPFDGSWGYQPIGLFSPTSRFGHPDDFKYFVNYLHERGIGVILDWVSAHFPTDEHGLAKFDGTHLYEHAEPKQGFHPDWNTNIYNYSRHEVRNYLIDSACYWLDEYHIDGLRVDAVASMLYLDYSREHGEWVPNFYGGNENLDAIEFIKQFNSTVYGGFPGIITIAEESTSWPGVTKRVEDQGLGFGFKWNMGWMHDTLNYLSMEPVHRKFHHHEMTFGMLYAYSENFVLPLSHDEVVHGKKSLISKMPGDRWQQFANLRAYYAFMWAYPGKKLLFMGGEFAQYKEWNHDVSLDWHLAEDSLHQGIMGLIRDLNRLYRDLRALHELDCSDHGFSWLEADNAEESVYAFIRRSETGDVVVAACNFTPVARHQHRLGVPLPGLYREMLNTDSEYYGGSNVGNTSDISSEPIGCHGQSQSIEIVLPPLAACLFVCSA